MMTCPRCQSSNDPTYKFCDSCGAPLSAAASSASHALPTAQEYPGQTIRCTQCGQTAMPGEIFCDSCGAPLPALQGGAIAPPAPIPPQPFSSPVLPQPVPPSRATLRCAALIIQSTGAEIAFPDQDQVLIGRSDPVSNHFPDIDLTSHNGAACGVSRNHACIRTQNGQVLLEDLNATNHTRINKQQLQPKQPHVLQDGDEVRFGDLVATFRLSERGMQWSNK